MTRAGQYQEAYEELLRARTALPDDVFLTHAMARFLAACPDDTLRDGQQALELALSAFKIRNNPLEAETVAMAYAQLGNFEEAILWQSEIVQGAEQSRRDDLLPRARAASVPLPEWEDLPGSLAHGWATGTGLKAVSETFLGRARLPPSRG